MLVVETVNTFWGGFWCKTAQKCWKNRENEKSENFSALRFCFSSQFRELGVVSSKPRDYYQKNFLYFWDFGSNFGEVKSGESRSGKSQDPACFCKKKVRRFAKKIETLDSCNFVPTGPILMFLVPRMCSSSWKARKCYQMENIFSSNHFLVRWRLGGFLKSWCVKNRFFLHIAVSKINLTAT